MRDSVSGARSKSSTIALAVVLLSMPGRDQKGVVGSDGLFFLLQPFSAYSESGPLHTYLKRPEM